MKHEQCRCKKCIRGEIIGLAILITLAFVNGYLLGLLVMYNV